MTDLLDIGLKTIAGADATLRDWAGQVLLVVNVASRCSLTPQYAALEALHAKYRDEGLAVLGFPANDFADQEPGDEREIAAFCAATYQVSFPLFAKVQATGDGKHPLYAALIAAVPATTGADGMRERLVAGGWPVREPPELLWNFEKFLIGRDGLPVARFAPETPPDDPRLVQAIERELFASE